jgi:hypothetical protein
VAVTDVHQRGAHLGDDPLPERTAISAHRFQQVRPGVVDDHLSLGADRVGDRLLPDLIADVVGGGSRELNVEHHLFASWIISSQLELSVTRLVQLPLRAHQLTVDRARRLAGERGHLRVLLEQLRGLLLPG